jgi:tryptophan synthase alpha subunit
LGNGEKASIWVTNGNDIYPIWLIFEMENREYDEYADRGIDKMILATTPDEAIDQAEQFLDRIGVNYMDFCAISSTRI